MFTQRTVSLLLLLLVWMASATAEELIGQVVGVTDGDTLT